MDTVVHWTCHFFIEGHLSSYNLSTVPLPRSNTSYLNMIRYNSIFIILNWCVRNVRKYTKVLFSFFFVFVWVVDQNTLYTIHYIQWRRIYQAFKQNEYIDKLSINSFFLFTCKFVIWKMLVKNQNLNKKLSSLY